MIEPDRATNPEVSTPAGDVAPEAARIKANIENSRAEVTAAITELETKLSPKEIREQVGEAVREHLSEAKSMVKEEIAEAKGLLQQQVQDVEDRVRRGLRDARDTLKTDVQDAIGSAKRTIRAATLGKVEDIATQVGDTMNDTRETIIETVRQNPIPAALAGVGLVWLFMNRSSSTRYRTLRSNGVGATVGSAAHYASERTTRAMQQASGAVGRAAHQASDAARGAMHQASDAARGAMHQASETVSSTLDAGSALAHRAEESAEEFASEALAQARRAEQGIEQAIHANPLAFGAAAVVVGAALGAALPRTQREDEWMGEARDRVVTQAATTAQGAASALSKATEKVGAVTKALGAPTEERH